MDGSRWYHCLMIVQSMYKLCIYRIIIVFHSALSQRNGVLWSNAPSDSYFPPTIESFTRCPTLQNRRTMFHADKGWTDSFGSGICTYIIGKFGDLCCANLLSLNLSSHVRSYLIRYHTVDTHEQLAPVGMVKSKKNLMRTMVPSLVSLP